MKILIIGSRGFIGSHCSNHFSQFAEVWECDIVDESRNNYFYLNPENPDFTDVFSSQDFDVCINCSGAANVQNSITNPKNDYKLNTLFVLQQLNALRKYTPNCKYLHISSAAVYGNPVSLPIKEINTLSPISPYGEHKKMAEEICTQCFLEHDINTISIRVFSAYGPGLKKQLFWDLYRKYKTQNKIELYGTGLESRDFIYIDDLIFSIECVIKNAVFNGGVINVANGEEIYIKDAAKIFYEYLDPT